MRRVIILLAICLPLVSVATTVYTSRDDNGNIVFSDHPSKGSAKMALDPISVANTDNPEALNGDDPDASKPEKTTGAAQSVAEATTSAASDPYTSLEGAFPNTSVLFPYAINFKVKVAPRYMSQDNLLLILDGKPVAVAAPTLPPVDARAPGLRYVVASTQSLYNKDLAAWYSEVTIPITGYTPENLAPGSHQWSVEIRNAQNVVLMRSKPVSFSVLWHHNLHTTPAKKGNNAAAVAAFTFNVLLTVARNMISPI